MTTSNKIMFNQQTILS